MNESRANPVVGLLDRILKVVKQIININTWESFYKLLPMEILATLTAQCFFPPMTSYLL